MVIRFQVDPDFYDHPKTTGMSDAAFSLWVRAGSFSAAKLQDGFISEDVLVHTLRSNVEVAEELVVRGLWRRRKGGFQFHQYADRNLTKERVESDRATDRERKRKTRGSVKPQEEEPLVRPDSERNPDGIQAESEGIPERSVSVSVSVSESVSESGRPVDRCTRHTNDPSPPPCRGCASAREAQEKWDHETSSRRRLAIRACRLCDSDGRRWDPAGRHRGTVGACDHRPLAVVS
jgi:hypothetical protein